MTNIHYWIWIVIAIFCVVCLIKIEGDSSYDSGYMMGQIDYCNDKIKWVKLPNKRGELVFTELKMYIPKDKLSAPQAKLLSELQRSD